MSEREGLKRRIRRIQKEDWFRIFHETGDVLIDPHHYLLEVEIRGGVCRFEDGAIVGSEFFTEWYRTYFDESLEICDEQWGELVNLWLDVSVEANLSRPENQGLSVTSKVPATVMA